jgi:hypothetical protein
VGVGRDRAQHKWHSHGRTPHTHTRVTSPRRAWGVCLAPGSSSTNTPIEGCSPLLSTPRRQTMGLCASKPDVAMGGKEQQASPADRSPAVLGSAPLAAAASSVAPAGQDAAAAPQQQAAPPRLPGSIDIVPAPPSMAPSVAILPPWVSHNDMEMQSKKPTTAPPAAPGSTSGNPAANALRSNLSEVRGGGTHGPASECVAFRRDWSAGIQLAGAPAGSSARGGRSRRGGQHVRERIHAQRREGPSSACRHHSAEPHTATLNQHGAAAAGCELRSTAKPASTAAGAMQRQSAAAAAAREPSDCLAGGGASEHAPHPLRAQSPRL